MTWERSPNPGSETVGQICAVAPLQEEGRRGGAHTYAHSRAAPGRGTHPLRAGSGAFEGCRPVPSGSKSVGLSPTKVCALLVLATSMGILGLPPYLCLNFVDTLFARPNKQIAGKKHS